MMPDLRLRSRHLRLSLAVLFLLLAPMSTLGLGVSPGLGQTQPAQVESQDLAGIVNFVRTGSTESSLQTLDQLYGTTTGYPGYFAALEFVSSSLESLGYAVEHQPYEVVAPVDGGSKVTVDAGGQSVEFQAYGVWPNYVQTSKTPPSGVSGLLVYVGHGSLDEMRGKTIEGSIVMMEIDSGSNWLNAMELGAKGLIYLEGEMTSLAVENMVVRAPVYFPRVCVAHQEAQRLRLLEGYLATVVNGMEYRTITAKNVIARLEGSPKADEVVVIAAHLDSWSIVPGLSSPASEAPSVAALIELARYFSTHRPEREVWIVTLSGHYEALAGARAFAEEAFLTNKLNPEGKRLLAFFGIDLSTETSYMDTLYAGFFYSFIGAGPVTKFQSWLQPMIFSTILPALSRAAGFPYSESVENGFRSDGWWASSPAPYMLDSEPFAVAHGLGFTLRTSRTQRSLFGTTSITSRSYQMSNLEPQVILAIAIANQLCNDLSLPVNWDSIRPGRIYFTTAEIAGMVHVVGTVMIFNLTKSWYTPIGGALVVANRDPTSPFLFGDIMTFANEEGRFNITGAGMGYALGGLSYGIGGETIVPGYYVQAYIIDRNSGMIEYAPDLGDYGGRVISFWASADTHPYETLTVVFPCASAAIVGFVDPKLMSPSKVNDPRFTSRFWINLPSDIVVYDARTISQFISWGMVRSPGDRAIVVFGPPDTRFMLMARVGPERRMSAILTNSSELEPAGAGYSLRNEVQMRITTPTLAMAKDMYYTTLDRYLVMNASFVRRSSVESSLMHAFAAIREAIAALQGKDYAVFRSASYSALGWINSAYEETMSLVTESSVTSIVFFLLLAPFCFLFEGLSLVRRGMSKLFAISGLLMFGLLTFYFLNPSLKVAQNAFIGFLGLALTFLLGIVLAVIANESVQTVKYYRMRAEGQHRIEESKLSTTSFSFDLALGNMRRRKMRTFLLVATVAIIVFGLTSLTSTEVYTAVQVAYSDVEAPYDGVYLKKGLMRPGDFLGEQLVAALEKAKAYGAQVAPRATYYPQSVSAMDVFADIERGDSRYRVNAVMGMSPEDADIHPAIRQALLPESRWFVDEDYFSAIVCSSARDALSVELGDEVEWQGLTLTVVGVFDGAILNREFVELGQERIASPLDPNRMVAVVISQSAAGEEQYNPLSWDSVLILPYRLTIDLGGTPSSVSIKSEDPDVTVALAKELAMIVNVDVDAGIGGKVVRFSRLMTTVLGGYQYLIFPLVVAAGTILNSLLGLLRERENETKIFSSLGLSPWGVGVLYISEILTLVIVGALIGYLSGLAGNAALITFRFLPSSFVLNFSSVFIILSLGITMIAALLSGIYPAVLAAKLATPSLERKWKIPTSPVGNEWAIPLPFSFPTKEEAKGLLKYLEEFAVVHSVETGEKFQVRSFKLDLASMQLDMTVALYPYEANVIQTSTVKGHETFPEAKWEFELLLVQLSGEKSVWLTSNYDFVDSTRKQFLLWRSLTGDQKVSYIERTSAHSGEKES